MIYIKLFFIFFKIGLFSFGGGYAILALLQKDIVNRLAWISSSEFTEMVALSQITPGPIAINLATHVGYRIGNTFGAFIATFGVIAPSILVISLIVLFLKRFNDLPIVKRIFQSLKIVVVGLILGAALSLFISENFIDYKSYIIFFMTIILGFYFKISTIFLIIISGFAGLFLYYI